MGLISAHNGDYVFETADEAMDIVKSRLSDKNDIWISLDDKYPCLVVWISGDHAALNYYQDEAGEMWLSYNADNHEEVSFMAGGEEWSPEATAIVSADNAYACIRTFLETGSRPDCIKWQEL